jgi:hypothetical protein
VTGRRSIDSARGWLEAGASFLPIAAVVIFACARSQDPSAAPPASPAIHADDASRLNRTRVAEVVEDPRDPAALESQLALLLARAREQGRRRGAGQERSTPTIAARLGIPACAPASHVASRTAR